MLSKDFTREMEQKPAMKKITVGILAHVDAGKTTLSEALLYLCGMTRNLGRVDNKDAFLDNNELERKRGITIFSKQAVLKCNQTMVTLLDTPGHVDFSAEMERTLQVLDYAVLVINGADGIQAHTRTLWKLLRMYKIPVFLFINKMDQEGTDRDKLLEECRTQLSENCAYLPDSTRLDENINAYEELAMYSEEAMNMFLETGKINSGTINKMISDRVFFSCFFGSALKLDGIEELKNALDERTLMPKYTDMFSARVFKISRDEQDNRLTYLKVTGGLLRVRAELNQEKVTQIRIYSGEHYDTYDEVEAGTVCAVTGLVNSMSGMEYGSDKEAILPLLTPVLTYQIILPEEASSQVMLPKLRQLEEEDPQLHVVWDSINKQIHVQVMGQIQIEILREIILNRFQVSVEIGTGAILYKETILKPTEGIGHFEPLKHYAEVHLLMEPLETGSGIIVESALSEDKLDRNWQRLILTHILEREHIGVLTGSPLTDMKISLVAGKAHPKHTEGGDFRQAVYRAIRQGLMSTENLLLEPYYSFELEIPLDSIGRAMSDIDRRYGHYRMEQTQDNIAVLRGLAPVALMQDYQQEVAAYTRGLGRFSCEVSEYGPCHNATEVIEHKQYNPDADIANTSSSVFCAHGAGFIVPWYQVKDYMHVESNYESECNTEMHSLQAVGWRARTPDEGEYLQIGTDEIDRIIEKTYYSNSGDRKTPHKGIRADRQRRIEPVQREYHPVVRKSGKKYLLVDGYNVIHAWTELSELAVTNMDGARGRLLDILSNYRGQVQEDIIVVFDAYRVTGHKTEVLDFHNIHVVYTQEAETADQYIEKFAHDNGTKHDVTVATSDGLEQIIIRGDGCHLISAREFESRVNEMMQKLRDEYHL